MKQRNRATEQQCNSVNSANSAKSANSANRATGLYTSN